MYRLKTFGALELAAESGPQVAGLLVQPKRGALLVYLVVEGTGKGRESGAGGSGAGRFHRRDSLTALFWPELDQERARHALRQTVYLLRQTLGRSAIVSRGEEELGLAASEVWCDARAFQTMLAAGQLEAALDLYRGDFLAGFHPSETSAEFEDWLDATRRRLRLRATEAALAAGRTAEQSGDASRALHWNRWAVQADPTSESGQRALMELLVRQGDVSAALRAFEQFSVLLRREVDAEPGAVLTALAEQWRQSTRRAPLQALAPELLPTATTIPAPSADSAPAAATIKSPRLSRPLAAITLGVTGFAAVVAIGLAVRGHRHSPPPLLAVGNFLQMTGRDSVTELPVLSDLLATSLARLPAVPVLSGPRLLEIEEQLGSTGQRRATIYRAARIAGATLLLQGRIRNDASGQRLDLELLDLGSGTIQGSFHLNGTDLFTLADSATALLATHFGVPPPDQPVAEVTTRSVVAYRLYEEGLRAIAQSDAEGGFRLFQAALEEDSVFAMAAYYAALTGRALAPAHADEALTYHARAERLAPRASERERLLIQASVALWRLDPVALAIADSLVARYPSEPDGYLLLAEAQANFQSDPAPTMRNAERVLALDSTGLSGATLPCRVCQAYGVLILTAAEQDSFPRAERTARAFIARRPNESVAHGWLAFVLQRQTRVAEAREESRIRDSLSGTRHTVLEDYDLLIRVGEFAAADHLMEEASSSGSVAEREDAAWWLAISLRAQGRLAAARTLLTQGRTPEGRRVGLPPLEANLPLAQVMCEGPNPAEGARMFRSVAGQGTANPELFHRAKHVSWHLTHVATCLALAGDTGRLQALADTVASVGAGSPNPRDQRLHHYIRGLLLDARGEWAAALQEYQAAVSWPVEGFTRINYEMAGTLIRLGRPREAIGPLQAALRGPLEAGGLYLTRTELEQRLGDAYLAAGAADSAQAHFAWAERAWRGADPQFRQRYQAVWAAIRTPPRTN